MQYDVWFRTNIQKLLISHLQTTTRKKKIEEKLLTITKPHKMKQLGINLMRFMRWIS